VQSMEPLASRHRDCCWNSALVNHTEILADMTEEDDEEEENWPRNIRKLCPRNLCFGFLYLPRLWCLLSQLVHLTFACPILRGYNS
jgi:hypothetical protein